MTNNAKTNEMREELIERAKAMLKSRHIESPFDVSHDELPSLLASFAADVLAEREARLTATLRKCESTAKLLSETLPAKGGGNLAHELLGELREVLDGN